VCTYISSSFFFFFFRFIYNLLLSQLGLASALETLCGQAFGAKKYYMLGVYLQRAWIILFICCVLILPLFLFTSPILRLMGQPPDVAELTGVVAVWIIPLHFCLGFLFPLQRFLQCQLKTAVIAWLSLIVLVVHVITSWLFVYAFKLGVIGTAVTFWWVPLDLEWFLH
jgi:MATE family multidrug resistance protein